MAKTLGGKRNVMSGGSVLGGGDIVFPAGHPLADFSWEVKAKKIVPEIVRRALQQAKLEASASTKMPAAVIKADNYPATVHFLLDDFVQWAEAFAELGQGAALKSHIRSMRRALEEMEGLI